MFALKPEDPVKGIRTPEDYNYIKVIRFTLRFLGAWPGLLIGDVPRKYEVIPAYFHFVVSLIAIVLMGKYLSKNYNKIMFIELGHAYITFFMTFVILTRLSGLVVTKRYRNLVTDFVQRMHLFHYKDKSDFAMKIHCKIHKLTQVALIYLLIMVFSGYLLFNLIPIYNNWKNGLFNYKTLVNSTYEQSLYYDLPYVFTNFNAYLAVTIFNWYATAMCTLTFCSIDLILCLIVINIWGHFKILLHDLDTFPKPAALQTAKSILYTGVIYTKSESKNITDKLKNCIDYHRLIKSYTTVLCDASGLTICIYYMFFQVTLCICMLECSVMTTDSLMRYSLLTLILFFELIQISVVFETINTESGKLKDAVYNLPWEHMNTKNRKTVLIFLMNVQEPISMNAMGLVSVGVNSMAMIIKTTLSYFAFVRTFT